MGTKELGEDFGSDHDIEGQDFVQLWQRHYNELYGLCLHWMGGHHADAEEALGNASMAALVKFKEIGASLRNPRAWLNRLCRNACMDLYRQRQRQRELALMELEDLESTGGLWGTVIPRTPQQSYLDRELSSFVRQAIGALPPRLRAPMVLRFFRQKPYRKVADELGITEENVRKRIQQAREILRARLVDYKAGRSALADADPVLLLALEEEMDPPDPGRGTGGPGPARLAAPGGAPQALRVQMCGSREKTFILFLERHKERRPATKIPALSRYVQKHPSGWKKRLELAEALFLTGRWEEAVAQYRLVLLKKPLLLEVWTRLGDLLRRMGRDREAEEAFGAALAVARGEAARRHVQGWIEVCRRRFPVAGEAFAEAAVLEPANPAHGLALAAVRLEEDRTAEAVEAFEEILARDPDNLSALLSGHEALWTAGRQGEAARRAAHALELDPDNFVAAQRVAELRIRRGLVHGAEGRETRRLLARVVRLAPEWPDGWAAMAWLHARRGRPAESEAVLSGYVREHPLDARGWILLACLLAGNGDFAAAADAALRSLDLEEELEAHLAACEILSLAGRSAAALQVCVAMLERFPASWRAWGHAARAFLCAGRCEEACGASSWTVHLQPRLAAAWLAHGTHLLRRGSWREAAFALEQGWALLPRRDAFALAACTALRLGEVYRSLAELDRAETWNRHTLAAALELREIDLVEGLLFEGRARLGLGDRTGAAHAFQAALDHHASEPGRTEARKALRDLRADEG